MNVVLVGAGRMGLSLAQQLEDEGHQIFVVDRDPSRVELVRTRLDAMAIEGSASRLKTYRDNDLAGADYLIAATNSDEVNIVACLLAKEVGIRRRIARLHSADLAEDLREMDLSVLGVDEFINPVNVTVERLRHIITTPGTTESAEFAGERIVLRALRVEAGSPLCEAPLLELHRKMEAHFLLALVRRGEDLVVPTGSYRLAGGDVIYVLMEGQNLRTFLRTFRFDRARTRRVTVFGASAIGCRLCQRLEDAIDDVVLLEPDADRCARAAETLANTSVIHGSALDQALMEDLKSARSDCFAAVTESDEANLAAALWAKRLGVSSTLMLTGEPEHVALFETLPLDAVVSPLLLSAGAILRGLREGRVYSLYKLAGDRAEALEIEAEADAPAVGRPLRSVPFPRGVMVAAVMDGRDSSLAAGDTVVRPGNRVVVVALREAVENAVSLFNRT